MKSSTPLETTTNRTLLFVLRPFSHGGTAGSPATKAFCGETALETESFLGKGKNWWGQPIWVCCAATPIHFMTVGPIIEVYATTLSNHDVNNNKHKSKYSQSTCSVDRDCEPLLEQTTHFLVTDLKFAGRKMMKHINTCVFLLELYEHWTTLYVVSTPSSTAVNDIIPCFRVASFTAAWWHV